MKKPGRIKVPSFLNSRYFETYFFERIEKALQKNPYHIFFDMRYMVWSDLMELLCIPLAICWLKQRNIKVELRCFRPYFSTNMEHKTLDVLGIDKKPISNFERKNLIRNNSYKNQSDFFWGTLHPFSFFDSINKLDIPCYLEDWYGDRILLSQSLIDILSPKEKISLRYYGLEDIYIHSQVDNAVNGIEKILKNFSFINDQHIKVYLNIINNTGKNIFDHAYNSHSNTPMRFKKGFIAVRVFSKKGFGKIISHAPEVIKKYIEHLRSKEVISISVVDAGDGIWKVLDPNKTMSELESIKFAFEKYTSSKSIKGPYDPKRGIGLYDVQKIINAEEGYLEVRSGKSRYVILPEKMIQLNDIDTNKLSINNELNEFPGVQYRIYIPIKGYIKENKQLSLFEEGS